MSRFRLRRATGVLLLGLCAWSAGCGSGPVAVDAPQSPVRTPHASPSQLLATPRAELAKQFVETAAEVQTRERAHRDGTLQFGLLPRLRLPLILPIWAESDFSAKMECSLPPYIAEGTKDNHLALHLARFGDAEAARRLTEPDDQATLQKIAELSYERNYPAEWTRLVGLMLHTAEYRLAMGDDEGRAELASLHREIRELLDAKAARGPLGAALLAQGHNALNLAARAWREHSQPELADKADADLAAWGDFPAPVIAVPLGASSAAVADMLRSQGKGTVVPALNTSRALDLFSLPVTGEGAQAVIACFDATDKLAEILVVYRPRIADYYLEPAYLVLPLEDHGIPGTDLRQIASVHRRDYAIGQLACEAAIVPSGYVLGAFVRFAGSGGIPAPVALPRDFGVVNLDRSFGQNRLRLVPEQMGDTVHTTRGPILAKVSNPLAPLAPTEAILQRDGLYDVVKSFGLFYSPEEGALFQTALPLWSELGPGRIEPVDDQNGGHLTLQWQDAKTHYVLRLPHVSGRAFELEIADARGPESLPTRAAAAEALDRRERRERIEAKTPLSRIPRRFDVGWSNPSGFVQLGLTRDQTLAALPRGQSIVRQNGPDFLNVLLTGEPPRSASRVVRQVLIRFGPDQKAAEIRLRYFDGPGSNSTARWEHELMTSFTKPCGAAAESLGPWSALWSDLPARKPVPILARWHDDITALTLQRDATGAEAIVRDCPLNQPTGAALPPLTYLPRGPEGCLLGESRDDLLRRFSIDKPQTLADAALVLPPPRGGPYDALLVWFHNDRVQRIVARHAPPAGGTREAASPSAQITQTWARSIRSLGWPTRQDIASESLQSLGWHDDLTRVRIFWQESDDGPPRVFTEWKDIAEQKKQ